jgi:uncharacterized repeat protein (TIGR03803 family)
VKRVLDFPGIFDMRGTPNQPSSGKYGVLSMSVLTRLFGIVLGFAALAAGPAAQATTLTTLYSFTGGAAGANPEAGLVFDTKGALYGTTVVEGADVIYHGTVFKFDPATKILTILHVFTGGADGALPVAGLVFDTKGALYGTTIQGGAYNLGTMFKLDPASKALTTLHSFTGADGSWPFAVLVFGTKDTLYGTTAFGGAHGYGTLFKLDTATKALTTLHSFTGADGSLPTSVLVFDTKDALYGTTLQGGAHGFGTVFKLDTATKVLTTLHSFTGADGSLPYAVLVFDTKGALYGTTFQGGAHNVGTVFKLEPATKELAVLHSFRGTDGANPNAGLVFDTKGELYSTTGFGGKYGKGTVFKLDLATKVLTTLHAFTGADGANPYAGLVFDTKGALYSTTIQGGAHNLGTAFKLVP